MQHKFTRVAFAHSVRIACTCAVLSSQALTQYQAAFTPASEYQQTLFVTPNGDPCFVAPMVRQMLGVDPSPTSTKFGAGDKMKVGIVASLDYTTNTEGAPGNYRYYVNRGRINFSAPLPPNVTLADLPPIVHNGLDPNSAADDLAGWATSEALVPWTVAALEWAKYYDVPVTFQILSTLTHGGTLDPNFSPFDLDCYFESLGKNLCMWDISDIVDPDDDNASTPIDAGAGWGTFSYATPTIADPAVAAQMGWTQAQLDLFKYREWLDRNLEDGVRQILAIAADPRYRNSLGQGLVAGFAIDPEHHFPAHATTQYAMPVEPGSPSEPAIYRPILEDYNPVAIKQFGLYERARYGDSGPATDSNGDGITFWSDFGSDYVQCGGFGHAHTQPTTWSAALTGIDPPRVVPATWDAPRSKYWNEWTNFRKHMMEEFIEAHVRSAIDGGCPPERLFTHQTFAGASYFRAHALPGLNNYPAEWLDDWQQMEISGGFPGSSIYTPQGVGAVTGGLGSFFYDNLKLRDEGFGSPEYNPMVLGGGQFADYITVQTAVEKAYDTGAHILWPHAWPSVGEPGLDSTSAFWQHVDATGNLQNWTANLMQTSGSGINSTLTALHDTDSYIQLATLPATPLIASDFTHLAMSMTYFPVNGTPGAPDPTDLVVKFQRDFQPTWYTYAEPGVLRGFTYGDHTFVARMHLSSQWTGQITGLRVYPAPITNSAAHLGSATLVRPNDFTHALGKTLADHDSAGRPSPSATLDLTNATLPIDLRSLVSSTNLAVYGCDPLEPVGGPVQNFGDFRPTNGSGRVNFDQANVSCGGVVKASILAPAPQYLGMTKTGKWRRTKLPDVADLYVSFYTGIAGSGAVPAGEDGACFRVVLRDEDRTLADSHDGLIKRALFDAERRTRDWSAKCFVPLDRFRGHTVELAFETQGNAESNGDQSAWGEPKIERAYNVTMGVATGGGMQSDPTGLYGSGTQIAIVAIANPGYVFDHWDVTGGSSVASGTSASTTLTVGGNGSITPRFARVVSIPSAPANVDGWTRQTAQGIQSGGTNIDATSNTGSSIRAGDSASNCQYRSVMSFDLTPYTDINSSIRSATLTMTLGQVTGTPTTLLGDLLVDVQNGTYGTLALQSSDWQAGSTHPASATVTWPSLTLGTTFTASIPSADLLPGSINQLKLRFTTQFANPTPPGTAVVDLLGFWPGENAQGPQLQIVVYP